MAELRYAGVAWDKVPDELRRQARWVFWRWEDRGERGGKKPCDPAGHTVDLTDSRSWSTAAFVEREMPQFGQRHHGGAGFVFTRDDALCGIDLDNCRDPHTGVLDDWALALVRRFETYTEVSPSGTGVKLFLQAGNGEYRSFQPNCESARPGAKIEIFFHNRYFTVTGQRIAEGGTRVRKCRRKLRGLLKDLETSPAPEPAEPRHRGEPRPDAEVLARAKRAANGAKFSRLWAGDWNGYRSHSNADMALMGMLDYGCAGDEQQVVRLFKQSGLYRPQKPGGDGYLLRTLRKVRRLKRAVSRPAGWSWLPHPDLPVIDLDEPQYVERAAAVLSAYAGPGAVYARAGGLVALDGDEDDPWLAAAEHDHLHAALRCAAQFVRQWPDGDGLYERRRLPAKLVRAAASKCQRPPLDAVVRHPVVRSDGTLNDAPGYDHATRLFHAPVGGDSLLPEQLDEAAARQAARDLTGFLREVAGFGGRAGVANALALLLTPIIRPALAGPVPLAVIDETDAGFAELVSYLVLGQHQLIDAPTRVGDWRREMREALGTGESLLAYYHSGGDLTSPDLATALLLDVWRSSERQPALPCRVTWLVSGPGVRPTAQLASRSYAIQTAMRLAGDDLAHLALDRRSDCLRWLLTMAGAWYAAGRPAAPAIATLPDFAEWRDVIGGILHFAGIAGFLAGRDNDEAIADQDFLRSLSNMFAGSAFRASDVIRLVADGHAVPLPHRLLDADGQVDAGKLGRWLSTASRGPVDGALPRVVSAGLEPRAKVALWRLEGVG